MSEVSIANPTSATVLVAQNAPGAGVTGPDGCLYAAGHDTIYKISNSSGGCSFAPTSPAASIKLTPAVVSANPAQGTSQTFTATLQNVASPSNVQVNFLVSGANAQFKLANTTTAGSAAFTYSALEAGGDNITAVATVNGVTLASNTVPVTWVAGNHLTYLGLSGSPQGGTINQPVNIVASLTDISANPVAGVVGQSITLALGGSSCTATTNSAGNASCALTPSQAGIGTLSAEYAGSGSLAASAASVGFNVAFAQTPPPTVSIAVSPTSIAAGGPATLTWSSSNATACVASGAWSGSEALSGTQTVAPSAIGSYSYVLSCTGDGGSASATAVLSATLVSVTVHAKSGGGALSWPMLVLLALMAALRLRAAKPVSRFIFTGLFVASLITAVGVETARADQPLPASTPADWADQFYVGVRVGSMPVHLDSSKIDQGLTALGYGEVNASTDTSAVGESVFLGYEFTPYIGLELGVTHRDATVAQLQGNIASSANLTPLLQDTTELLRGYGNIVSLSYTARFEVAPRFVLEPRLGGFFWATKTTAIGLDDRFENTHEGGGVTVGATAAYRVWRGLEVGVSVDHFRGFPNNIATLYGGSIAWRFGH
jgi:hypothetical protein